MYAHNYLIPFCMLSLCIRAARGFLVKTVLDRLLATVENITNVNFVWDCILIGHTYQAVHNLWQTLSNTIIVCTAATLVVYESNLIAHYQSTK